MAHGEYREEFHGEHPHSYDHAEPKYSLLWILGGLTVILLIFVGIGIQLYYERTEERTVYDRVLSQDNWQLQDLRRKESWELTHYGYLDEAKTQVRLPIDQAMKLVAQEAAENRMKYPTKPYPIRTEEPPPGAAPAVAQPGAQAAVESQKEGVTSSPGVQQPAVPQQPNR